MTPEDYGRRAGGAQKWSGRWDDLPIGPCAYFMWDQRGRLTPEERSAQMGDANRAGRWAGRYWPTDVRRPHESVGDWCRRLDDLTNGPPPAEVA